MTATSATATPPHLLFPLSYPSFHSRCIHRNANQIQPHRISSPPPPLTVTRSARPPPETATMVWRRICHHRNPWFRHLHRRFHSPNRLPRPIPPNPSSRLISSVSHPRFAHSGDPCLTWYRRFSSQAWIDVPTSGVVEVPLAQTGEGIAECEIVRWFVEEGDLVEEFQRLCEVQSDKATIEITSRYKGKVCQVLCAPGDIVKVGEALLKIHVEEIHSPIVNVESLDGKIDSESCEFNSQSFEKEKIGGVLATPSVRHLAKQYGIDINDIHGTGKDGRVLKEDVIAHGAGQGICEDSPAISSAFTEESVSVNDEIASQAEAAAQQYYEDKTLPLRGFQRSMVKSMTMAAKVPHFHYLEEINFDALLELKDTFQNENTEKEVKHTCLPFLIKSLSLALGKYPSLNSSFNEEAYELVLKGSHNVGVAMATPYGLVVPNIKKVQSLSILEITKELSRLHKMAMDNRLSSKDISCGTITLSNIGAIGGKFGSPLLNLPEVAIIAVGRIHQLPRFTDDGNVYPTSVANVTIGADHRVVDGAMVARFCNEWKLLIEKPELLLLHMR